MAGRRGAMTTAAIPAAVAPIVADWNAHRMSSPPEPRTSMTAIAPRAHRSLVSRRTTTKTIPATTRWSAKVTARYGQYETVPTVPTSTR